MQVRRYVMDLLYNRSGESVRVPSYNVLSKKLGMARSTAQMELKSLVDEGFLIAKVGIGTFTNPAIDFGAPKDAKNPLIGVLDGDGLIVHDRYYGVALRSWIEMELAKLPATIQWISRFSEKEEDFFEELRGVQCDFIVWLRPKKELEPLARRLAAIRPILAVDASIDGVPCLDFDRKRKGYPVAKRLLSEGRTRLLFIQNERYRNTTYQAFKEVYGEAGLKLDERYFFELRKGLERVDEELAKGYRPQALMFAHECAESVISLLERHGVDMNEECRLVSPMFKPRALKAPMLFPEFPFQGYGKAVAEELAERLANPGLPPESRRVYCDFKLDLV